MDGLTELSEYDSSEIPESIDKTWIISGQSPAQKKMISGLEKSSALFVEGAFRVWLQKTQVFVHLQLRYCRFLRLP